VKTQKLAASLVVGVGMVALSSAGGYAQSESSVPGITEHGSDSQTTVKQASGEVTALDAKSGKLSVKTADQELDLKVQAARPRSRLSRSRWATISWFLTANRGRI